MVVTDHLSAWTRVHHGDGQLTHRPVERFSSWEKHAVGPFSSHPIYTVSGDPSRQNPAVGGESTCGSRTAAASCRANAVHEVREWVVRFEWTSTRRRGKSAPWTIAHRCD